MSAVTSEAVLDALPAPEAPEVPVTIIEPTNGRIGLRWRELWDFRELAYFLVWRDLKVRYKQTVLGAAWAVIPPVLTMVVFTLVLQKVAHFSSDGKPYALFSYTGLVPWGLFTAVLSGVAGSLLGNAQLVGKIYFPRLILPSAAALSPVVDFLIAFTLIVVLMVAYAIAPNAAALLIPLFVLLALLTAVAVGLWFAALNVKYRDFQYTVPFMVQLGLFITPVAYSQHSLPHGLQAVLALNPMTVVVTGFRWGLLGTPPPSLLTLTVATLATILLFVGGLAHFRRAERTFADII